MLLGFESDSVKTDTKLAAKKDPVTMNSEQLENSAQEKYLGEWIHEDGTIATIKKLNEIIEIAERGFESTAEFLKDKNIRIQYFSNFIVILSSIMFNSILIN